MAADAVTRIPTCHRSTSNSVISSEARALKMTWAKVATAMAAAVTAARDKRLNGRMEREKIGRWRPTSYVIRST